MRLSAITTMPPITLLVMTLSVGSYFCAVGSSSWMHMLTMSPATSPKMTPYALKGRGGGLMKWWGGGMVGWWWCWGVVLKTQLCVTCNYA